MLNKLEAILGPVAEKLNNNKTLMAIRDGLMFTTPLLVPASIFLLIANFPIPGYPEFMAGIFGEGWAGPLSAVSGATFSIVAFLNVLGIGNAYAKSLGSDGTIGSMVAFVSFLILLPQSHPSHLNEAGRAFGGFAYASIGAQGLFLAILTALLSVRIYNAIEKKGWVIKMPEGVPPNVAVTFSAILPAGVAMVVFFLLRILFSFTPYETAQNFIYSILQIPLMGFGRTKIFPIIYTFFAQLFWFFGIHGLSVTNAVFGPIMTAVGYENLAIFEQFGVAGTFPNIFTTPFYNFFGNIGGGGSTLSLVVCMMIFGKSKRMKQLGALSVVPGIFGINEMVIFGFPIVLNPIIIIPFILTPLVNVIIGYFATAAGLMPHTLGIPIPWTTPIFFSGWLATGNFLGALWQLIFLVTGIVIYYPFFKVLDDKYFEEETTGITEGEDDLEDIALDDLSFD